MTGMGRKTLWPLRGFELFTETKFNKILGLAMDSSILGAFRTCFTRLVGTGDFISLSRYNAVPPKQLVWPTRLAVKLPSDPMSKSVGKAPIISFGLMASPKSLHTAMFMLCFAPEH